MILIDWSCRCSWGTQALEAEEKLNAKLDILTRLQAGRAAQAMKTANPATPSTVYDDSDEEGESEESEDDEGESEDGSERVTTGEASFTSEATNEQDAQVADMLLAVDGEVEADTSLAAEVSPKSRSTCPFCSKN